MIGTWLLKKQTLTTRPSTALWSPLLLLPFIVELLAQFCPLQACAPFSASARPRSQLESPSRQPVLNRRCCLPCGMARSSSSSPTLEPSRLRSPPLPPTQTPANSSPTAAARLFSLASLLLVGGWALAAGGPPPVAAVIPNGFGTKPCPCRPHHPLHPQVAFCASDFALKVRFLRMTGEYLSSTMHLKRYWVSVKAVFRNSAKIPNLIPNRRMHLWIYGERDNCGHGIVVRYHGEANSIISREVHLKKLYLVTGKLEHGQPMLSVCSWIAQWPNKTMRKAIINSELGSPVVTDQQARYLRHGTYARGCSKCRWARKMDNVFRLRYQYANQRSKFMSGVLLQEADRWATNRPEGIAIRAASGPIHPLSHYALESLVHLEGPDCTASLIAPELGLGQAYRAPVAQNFLQLVLALGNLGVTLMPLHLSTEYSDLSGFSTTYRRAWEVVKTPIGTLAYLNARSPAPPNRGLYSSIMKLSPIGSHDLTLIEGSPDAFALEKAGHLYSLGGLGVRDKSLGTAAKQGILQANRLLDWRSLVLIVVLPQNTHIAQSLCETQLVKSSAKSRPAMQLAELCSPPHTLQRGLGKSLGHASQEVAAVTKCTRCCLPESTQLGDHIKVLLDQVQVQNLGARQVEDAPVGLLCAVHAYTKIAPRMQPVQGTDRFGQCIHPKGPACETPTFETEHNLIEIRRLYTNEAGVWKDGFPAIYLAEPEWKKLEAARPDLEAAARLHVNKRVLLGNFKAVEASRGRIRLLRNWLNQDPKFNWRYTIEFTPELWRRMFAARLDKLFKPAPEAPPPAKRVKTDTPPVAGTEVDVLQLMGLKPYQSPPWENLFNEGTENNGSDNWEADQYLAWAMSYDSDTESEVFDLPLLAIGGVVNGAPAATASDLTTASAALFDVSVEELTTTGPASAAPVSAAAASTTPVSAAASTTSHRASISSAATLLLFDDEDEDMSEEIAVVRERFPRIVASFFRGDIDWLRSRHPGGLPSQATFVRAFNRVLDTLVARGAGLREVLEAETLHQDWLMGRNSYAPDSEAYLAGPGARPTAWDEPAAWPSNWEEHLSLVRYTASLRLWRLEDDLDLSSDYCFESVEEEAAYETALREPMATNATISKETDPVASGSPGSAAPVATTGSTNAQPGPTGPADAAADHPGRQSSRPRTAESRRQRNIRRNRKRQEKRAAAASEEGGQAAVRPSGATAAGRPSGESGGAAGPSGTAVSSGSQGGNPAGLPPSKDKAAPLKTSESYASKVKQPLQPAVMILGGDFDLTPEQLDVAWRTIDEGLLNLTLEGVFVDIVKSTKANGCILLWCKSEESTQLLRDQLPKFDWHSDLGQLTFALESERPKTIRHRIWVPADSAIKSGEQLRQLLLKRHPDLDASGLVYHSTVRKGTTGATVILGLTEGWAKRLPHGTNLHLGLHQLTILRCEEGKTGSAPLPELGLMPRRPSGSSNPIPSLTIRAAESASRGRRPARSSRRSGLIQRALDEAQSLRLHLEQTRAARKNTESQPRELDDGTAQPSNWWDYHQEDAAGRAQTPDGGAQGEGSSRTPVAGEEGGVARLGDSPAVGAVSASAAAGEAAEPEPMEIGDSTLTDEAENEAQKTKNPADQTAYLNSIHEFKRQVRNAKTNKWREYCEELEGSRPTSRIVKALTLDKMSKLSSVKRADGSLTENPGETLEAMLTAFFPNEPARPDPPDHSLYGVEIPSCKQTKCLGVTLDHRLSWSTHVQAKTKKALAILAQLRRAVGTTWGLTPKRLWWIYTAMVRPAVTYAGLVWTSALQIKTCHEALKKVQGRACRMILNAPLSAPFDGLNAFLCLPPLDIFVRREAAKTTRRLIEAGVSFKPQRAMAKRKLLPHSDLCLKVLEESGSAAVLSDAEPRSLNLYQRFKVTIPSRENANDSWAPQEVHCFTDGSSKDGLSGFGVCILINGRVIATHAQHTGRLSSVFQNEVLAISSCAAELHCKDFKDRRIFFHSDSQAALQALCHTTTNSRTVRDCIGQLNKLARRNTVRLTWIPGHAGFKGNELADSLAKAGCSGSPLGPVPLAPIPATVINRQINDWADILHLRRWDGISNCRQSRAAVPNPSLKLRRILLNQNRKDIRALTMTFTGHGCFARHCFLRCVRRSELCPFCSLENEDAKHFVCYCPAFNRDRLNHLGPNPSLDDVCRPENIPRLIRFLRATKRASTTLQTGPADLPDRPRALAYAGLSGISGMGDARLPAASSDRPAAKSTLLNWDSAVSSSLRLHAMPICEGIIHWDTMRSRDGEAIDGLVNQREGLGACSSLQSRQVGELLEQRGAMDFQYSNWLSPVGEVVQRGGLVDARHPGVGQTGQQAAPIAASVANSLTNQCAVRLEESDGFGWSASICAVPAGRPAVEQQAAADDAAADLPSEAAGRSWRRLRSFRWRRWRAWVDRLSWLHRRGCLRFPSFRFLLLLLLFLLFLLLLLLLLELLFLLCPTVSSFALQIARRESALQVVEHGRNRGGWGSPRLIRFETRWALGQINFKSEGDSKINWRAEIADPLNEPTRFLPALLLLFQFVSTATSAGDPIHTEWLFPDPVRLPQLITGEAGKGKREAPRWIGEYGWGWGREAARGNDGMVDALRQLQQSLCTGAASTGDEIKN
uniref:RNase H domain-containing protein n=1 Tax=Macrostomum lignano TaxID=282301 RepID=A0A1I8IEW3_9PLAT